MINRLLKVYILFILYFFFLQNFESEDNDSTDLNKDKDISSTIQRDIIQSEELSQSRRESKSEESPAIIIASRPHSSSEISNYIENRLETSTQIEENLRVTHLL